MMRIELTRTGVFDLTGEDKYSQLGSCRLIWKKDDRGKEKRTFTSVGVEVYNYFGIQPARLVVAADILVFEERSSNVNQK